MATPEVQAINLTLDAAKKQVALAEALDRLANNADFKLVIEEGFFKDEPVRLTMLRAHPNEQDSASRANIDRGLDAVGYLNQYLHATGSAGTMARKAIISHDELLEEMAEQEAKS